MNHIALRIGALLIRYILSLWAASVVIFVLLRMVPGDPAQVALGTTATPAALDKMRHVLGTDQPLVQQYLQWVTGMLHGDFGKSYSSGTDIGPLLLDRTAVSLWLVLVGMVLAFVLAIPFGTWAAVRHRSTDGLAVSAASQIGIAIPSFLAALTLVSVISIRWGLLPATGWTPPSVDLGDFVARLALPALSLAIVQAAILTRYVRASVLSVLNQDFMRTARATGLSRWSALRLHGARNAAVPVIAISGVQLSTLVVGAVVIEQVFVIPGLGSFLLTAISNRDMITIQSCVMMLVIMTLTISVVTDLLAAVVDPRTKGVRRV